jgi:DNA-binding SARP family transcriptional activator
MLALHSGPINRRQLAGRLWPDHDEAYAMARLREALFHLRRSAGGLIDAAGAALSLSRDTVVDLRDLEAHVRGLLSGTPRCSQDTDAVVGSRRLEAELLDGWYDIDWIDPERSRWNVFRLASLDALSDRCREQGCHRHALELAYAAVRVDPYRESAHHKIIELHLSSGNRAGALAHVEEYRRLMVDDLGLEPAGDLDEVLDLVRWGRSRDR